MTTLAELDLSLPAAERGFRRVRSADWPGIVLILPEKGRMMAAAEWTEADLPFRSLALTDTGSDAERTVVSSGFPKFFNFGEHPEQTARMVELLGAGEPVRFTEKLDGSLVVRAVVGSRVMLRTRGQLALGPHAAAVEPLVEAAHPALLDPDFYPQHSILLELTSPSFRIVLPYPEDRLTLVGAIDHADLGPLELEALEPIAAAAELPLVPLRELPRDSEAMIAEVSAWKDTEGIVLRAEGGRLMLKLKAADYLTLHRLRFALSARVVREICLARDITSLGEFEAYLREQGGDWELVVEVKPLVEAFLAARQESEASLAALEAEVEQMAIAHPDRRDFALSYATRLKAELKSAAFCLLDGNRDRAAELILAAALDRAFADLDDDVEAEELPED